MEFENPSVLELQQVVTLRLGVCSQFLDRGEEGLRFFQLRHHRFQAPTTVTGGKNRLRKRPRLDELLIESNDLTVRIHHQDAVRRRFQDGAHDFRLLFHAPPQRNRPQRHNGDADGQEYRDPQGSIGSPPGGTPDHNHVRWGAEQDPERAGRPVLVQVHLTNPGQLKSASLLQRSQPLLALGV